MVDDEHLSRSLVGIEGDGLPIRISVRLATTRTVPSRTVVEQVTAAVREIIGTQPCMLDLELSYIE